MWRELFVWLVLVSVMRVWAILLAAILLAANTPAHAVSIVTHFVAEGNALPGIGTAGAPSTYTSGTGNLEDIVSAAADRWEQLILDDFTLTLFFGWFPTEPISASGYHQGTDSGGSPAREIQGSIAFNNDNNDSYRLFLDATPADESEFGSVTTAEIDLGAGPINSRRDYAPLSSDVVGSIDLYSTALHEIGHALGLTGWSFYLDEVSDGDIDVTSSPFAGTVVPVTGSHIDIVGPLMSSTGRALGHRRDVSQLDLLAVCEVSEFTDCVIAAPGDGNGDGWVDGLDYLIWAGHFNTHPAPDGDVGDGDYNDDGWVNGLDYLLWASEYGNHVAGAAVPESTTLTLATLGLIGVACRRRRR